jgi:hypothetical protein
LQGVTRRRGTFTTVRDRDVQPTPDLVSRNFVASAPNRLWVADITYIATWSGFLYLAVVLDAWSRRVVGWAMETHLRTELVLQAFDMALFQRRPSEVIHHSDQGCQYTSIAFGKRCGEAGVRPSMGSVGDAYDNAMDGCVSVHRGLVQPASSSLGSRLSLADRLRAETNRGEAPHSGSGDPQNPERTAGASPPWLRPKVRVSRYKRPGDVKPQFQT